MGERKDQMTGEIDAVENELSKLLALIQDKTDKLRQQQQKEREQKELQLALEAKVLDREVAPPPEVSSKRMGVT
jgi:hypothetical protein